MMKSLLDRFRDLMVEKNLIWYVVPRTDEHQSEYICECDKHLQFLSGFSGTNAIAAVSLTEALLWTDGRYFTQAEKQLKEGWHLKKLLPGERTWFEHIRDSQSKGRVGIDSRLISARSAEKAFPLLEEKGLQIVAEPQNLINELWEERPASTACEIFVHEEWAGKPSKQKVEFVRNSIGQQKANAALFSGLSEIAWILNLRSAEIPYNPYFKSILLISLEGGTLFLPKSHVSFNSAEVRAHLQQVNISIEDYPPKFVEKTLISKSVLSFYLYSNLQDPIEWEGVGKFRAVRDQKQIDGFRNCHVRDGVAMAKFWSWRSKQQICNEYQAALFMDKLRTEQELNKGNSFETTSAGGPNAAIIHYKPKPESNIDMDSTMIHLVDSGGQYLDGTTDATRTMHFGEPSAEEKDAYTRVLLGNLDVERMRWPISVELTGRDLDTIARRHLFAKGLNYLHGTGHGVGYFLGVHEGPVGISKVNENVFRAGMIVSNEPGFYKEGSFGIRIENLIMCREVDGCYEFENMTLCPYDLNLIDASLLSPKDRDHINGYHERVYATLAPRLVGDEETLQWLKSATRPL